ncbi:hypothetical protein, partial [Xanthovirga aplysinae]|uniref:hypothetical protein n=1 Tax=Xanthovirga aplysinae TaxID=2529853 RepID=UPI001657468D
YFSWSNMDEIHGDFQKKAPTFLKANLNLVSPSVAINQITQSHPIDSIHSIQLVEVLGQAMYRLKYFSSKNGTKEVITQLANAQNGQLRGPLQKEEAIALAKSRFVDDSDISNIEYLEQTGNHHEYRSGPLPAWVISFDHPSKANVYISANEGRVVTVRNQKWRIFDYLWMLHTMDYQGRDNFGNLLLRMFSIFGLLTISSGFVLYFISSPTFRKKRKPRTVVVKAKA